MTALSPQLKQATPVLVDRGEGVYLFSDEGRRYLDFTAGIGVTSTGHCHPTVVAAVQEQAARLIHGQYTTVMSRPLRDLTEQLGTVLPAGLDSLFFVNSGSEAIEAAMRLVRHATGRPGIVVFHGSFHGRTFGAAALTTSGTKFRAGIGPLPAGVAVSPFPFAYRYGWDEDTATDFALRELDYVLRHHLPRCGHRGVLRRARTRRGRLRPRERQVHARAAGARRPARHPARRRRGADRIRAHRPVLGPWTTSASRRRGGHRQGPGQRLPAVGRRGPACADGAGLAGFAGRDVRREPGVVRCGARDAAR